VVGKAHYSKDEFSQKIFKDYLKFTGYEKERLLLYYCKSFTMDIVDNNISIQFWVADSSKGSVGDANEKFLYCERGLRIASLFDIIKVYLDRVGV
jgi:hypothetical protein